MANKKAIIISSIVAAVAIAIGVSVTYVLASPMLEGTIDYNVDPQALEDDNDKLMNKYENSNGNYDSFQPYELANIALNLYDNSENHYSTVTGSVLAAGVTQTIYGATVRSGSEYFNENISQSGIVKVAKRFYQENDSINTYEGSVQSESSATWNSSATETLSTADYETKWGKVLARSNIYIISNKTVLDSSKEVDSAGNIVVKVNLDPILSVIRYTKQMVVMSDLESNPKFSSVAITFTMDSNLKLLTNVVDEAYTVRKVINANSTSTLYTTYHYDSIDIPDLSTNFIYE